MDNETIFIFRYIIKNNFSVELFHNLFSQSGNFFIFMLEKLFLMDNETIFIFSSIINKIMTHLIKNVTYPYFSHRFVMEFNAGEKFSLLTEMLKSFRIEDRILFLEFTLSRGGYIRTIRELKATNNIVIKFHDAVGEVVLQFDANCEFITTSSLEATYSAGIPIKLKVQFVLKSLECSEMVQAPDQLYYQESIKLF